MKTPSKSRLLTMVLAACAFLVGTQAALAQAGTAADRQFTNPRSRAEQVAEQEVALSPDKIIEILRDEPGLMLVSKRMLVRKAWEQGRILDPEDLTDEALFQLLREDHNICVLVTREIEDRSYIKAKPTRDEMERERQLQMQNRMSQPTSSVADYVPRSGS